MKKRSIDEHSNKRRRKASFFIMTMALGLLLFSPATGRAGLIMDAEVRVSYEDNVVGLLSDQNTGRMNGMNASIAAPVEGPGGVSGKYSMYTGMSNTTSGSPGDFSGTLSAAIGGYAAVFSESTVFMKGFAEYTSYETYRELDATIGGVSTGFATQLSNDITARVAITGKVKRFQDSQRDGNSYGGGVSLKENAGHDLWFKQFAEYEKNNADLSLFSYAGSKAGLSAGYALTARTSAAIGASYLAEVYDEPAGAALRTSTMFLNLEHGLSRTWFLSGEYGLQTSKDSTSGTSVKCNIYSLGLRYSY